MRAKPFVCLYFICKFFKQIKLISTRSYLQFAQGRILKEPQSRHSELSGKGTKLPLNWSNSENTCLLIQKNAKDIILIPKKTRMIETTDADYKMKNFTNLANFSKWANRDVGPVRRRQKATLKSPVDPWLKKVVDRRGRQTVVRFSPRKISLSLSFSFMNAFT